MKLSLSYIVLDEHIRLPKHFELQPGNAAIESVLASIDCAELEEVRLLLTVGGHHEPKIQRRKRTCFAEFPISVAELTSLHRAQRPKAILEKSLDILKVILKKYGCRTEALNSLTF